MVEEKNKEFSKSDFLLKVTEELIRQALVFGVNLVVCGGIAIHMLSDYLERKSPRHWNHKDIDLMVPLAQFSRTIAFFKSLGYIRSFVPVKKARLTKNHIRFVNTVDDTKILVDVYGETKIAIVRIKRNNAEVSILSPNIELENWMDRQINQGNSPSIILSIKFLNRILHKFPSEKIHHLS